MSSFRVFVVHMLSSTRLVSPVPGWGRLGRDAHVGLLQNAQHVLSSIIASCSPSPFFIALEVPQVHDVEIAGQYYMLPPFLTEAVQDLPQVLQCMVPYLDRMARVRQIDADVEHGDEGAGAGFPVDDFLSPSTMHNNG